MNEADVYAFVAELTAEEGRAAVRAALANSVLDGPRTARDAAMDAMDGRVRADWSDVIEGSGG